MIDELATITTSPFELSLTDADRVAISSAFLHWFDATNKRQSPDLDDKVRQFRQRLMRLARVIRFKVVSHGKEGRLTAEAPVGEPSDTMRQVQVGTLWFDGWVNWEYSVLRAVLE